MGVEERELAGETVGEGDVIAVEPSDVGAPRQPAAVVERGRDAEVRLVAERPDAPVGVREPFDDRGRAVARAVVHDHELELRERLGEHALDRLCQVAGAVEDGHHDAHARRRSAVVGHAGHATHRGAAARSSRRIPNI